MATLEHWAPLNVIWHSTDEGVLLQVLTDIPCHLYMRWSINPPRKHPASETRRGILIMTGVRFCFTAFHENEQIEPGDTRVHTFLKEPWAVCETRWFYFIGNIAGVTSPSASPLFEYHKKEPYTLSLLEPWTRKFVPVPTFTLLIIEPWTS